MPLVRPRRVLIAVVTLTTLFYLTLLFAPPLAWDDDSNIFANPLFRAGAWAPFWRSAYFGLYVPVTSTVWRALFAAGGAAAWPFRLLNAALHAANIILVYRLARRTRLPPGPAVVGAALFAVHPLQVAAVGWISGGRDLLAAFFSLVGLDLYLGAKGAPRRALATAAFAAAVLSKPSAVALPLVTWALAEGPKRRHASWMAGWLALAALVTAWTMDAQADFRADLAPTARAWLAGDALWFYLSRIAVGWPLAANYARTFEVVLGAPATLVGAAAGAAALGFVAVAGRARAYRAPLLAAVATLLPVSGLVSFGYQQTSGVADHYAYLTLAFAGLAVARVWDAHPRGRVIVTMALAAFAALSVARRSTYASNAAFFADMARAAPESYATAIGQSAVACAERGDFDAGLRWTAVALRARPLDVRALANQAYCRWHAGDASGTAAMAGVLDRLDRPHLARVQPTGYASLLATVGAGLIAVGRSREGFALTCEAAALFPADPAYAQNRDAAARILRERGLRAECP